MTSPATTPAQLGFVAPFFIVRGVMPAIAFYKARLGFELRGLEVVDADGYVLYFGRPV